MHFLCWNPLIKDARTKRKQNTVDRYEAHSAVNFPPLSAGSLGDLDGGEENTVDNLSLSGEEAGASDLDDSAEGDSSSPPPYTPLYNEGEEREIPAELTSISGQTV